MTEAIYTAGTGAEAEQQRLDILANNLANVQTAGYKADRVLFRSYLPAAQTAAAGSPGTDESLPDNYHVAFAGTRTDFSQGSIHSTGNPLDMAINGAGFFTVQTSNGPAYTRNGEFTRNANGDLVTSDGDPVLGQRGPIRIDGSRVNVDSKGVVSVDGATVDTLAVVGFANPEQLKKIGGSLFSAPAGISPVDFPKESTVSQGVIEESNVNAVSMMVEMIDTLRGYEAYEKAIQSVDQNDSQAIGDVGAPTS